MAGAVEPVVCLYWRRGRIGLGRIRFQAFGRPARLARGPGRGSRSAPEDAGGVALDFCEEVFDAVRRSNEVVEVEAQVAVSPVQGPRLAGGGVAKSGDGEAGPLRSEVLPPGLASFDDRQMARLDKTLDANLVAGMLGHSVGAPPLYSCDVQLRQAHRSTGSRESLLRR